MLETKYAHIVVNDDGVPMIAGTTTKVIEVVRDQRAHGWSPEEIALNYPDLSLGQIYSALAYYWDHQAELDADIEARRQYAEAMRQAAKPSPFVARLKAMGLR